MTAFKAPTIARCICLLVLHSATLCLEIYMKNKNEMQRVCEQCADLHALPKLVDLKYSGSFCMSFLLFTKFILGR